MPTTGTSLFWTPDRIERLQQLRALGLTTEEIGDRIGCSKSAVAGKLKRLRDGRTTRGPKKPRALPRRASRKRGERLPPEPVARKIPTSAERAFAAAIAGQSFAEARP